MNVDVIKIGDINFNVNDLGDLPNNQFNILYNNFLLTSASISEDFKKESFNYFDENRNDPESINRYFENFNPICLTLINQGQHKIAENFYRKAIDIAIEWQVKNNDRIHKGTPYYFWSITCILNEDLEKGFLLMHQALEEDKKTFVDKTPQSPSLWFVTLDYLEHRQFFLPKVLEIADFIDEKLNQFQKTRNGILILNDLKARFLDRRNLKESVFYFVFSIFNLKKLIEADKYSLTKNTFGSLLESRTLFDLCIVLENIIKKKIPKNKKEKTFSECLDFLIKKKYLLKIGINEKKDFNKIRDNNSFNLVIKKLLLSKTFKINKGCTLLTNTIDVDFLIAYTIRNTSAHEISNKPMIFNNFIDISQRVLNCIFFAVEKIY